MLGSSRVGDYREIIELPAALRSKMRMRIFDHVIDTMSAATGIATSESRATSGLKYDVQLILSKMPIKFWYIDPPFTASWSGQLSPIGSSEGLLLTHSVADAADGAERKGR